MVRCEDTSHDPLPRAHRHAMAMGVLPHGQMATACHGTYPIIAPRIPALFGGAGVSVMGLHCSSREEDALASCRAALQGTGREGMRERAV